MGARSRNPAPGHPGIPARWTSSAKSGVGTAPAVVSRVWFTLSHGILDEIYYPRVDYACTRDFGLIITDGRGYFSERFIGLPPCRSPGALRILPPQPAKHRLQLARRTRDHMQHLANALPAHFRFAPKDGPKAGPATSGMWAALRWFRRGSRATT